MEYRSVVSNPEKLFQSSHDMSNVPSRMTCLKPSIHLSTLVQYTQRWGWKCAIWIPQNHPVIGQLVKPRLTWGTTMTRKTTLSITIDIYTYEWLWTVLLNATIMSFAKNQCQPPSFHHPIMGGPNMFPLCYVFWDPKQPNSLHPPTCGVCQGAAYQSRAAPSHPRAARGHPGWWSPRWWAWNGDTKWMAHWGWLQYIYIYIGIDYL